MPSAESLYERIGGVYFPLSDTAQPRELDPLQDAMLAMFKAAVNAELATAWTNATEALGNTDLVGKLPIEQTYTFEASERRIREVKIGFPALFLWRTEAQFEPWLFDDTKLVQRWQLVYALPAAAIDDDRRIRNTLTAAGKIIDRCVRRRSHPAYESGALQFFGANFDPSDPSSIALAGSVRVVSSEGPAEAQFANSPDAANYLALAMVLETVEYSADDTASESDFDAVDYDIASASDEGTYPSLVLGQTDQDPEVPAATAEQPTADVRSLWANANASPDEHRNYYRWDAGNRGLSATPQILTGVSGDGHGVLAFDGAGFAWALSWVSGSETLRKFTVAALFGSVYPVPLYTIATPIASRGYLWFDASSNLWALDSSTGTPCSLRRYSAAQLTSGSASPVEADIVVSPTMSGFQPASDELNQFVFDDDGWCYLSHWDSGGTGKVWALSPAQVASSGTPTPVECVGSNIGNPEGVAYRDGKVWVADYDGSRLRSFAVADIRAGGNPTPLAEVYTASTAGPTGIQFDSLGNLWVANFDNDTVNAIHRSHLLTSGQKPDHALLVSIPEPLGIVFGPTP